MDIPKKIYQIWINYFWFFKNFFSIDLLTKTFFYPWKLVTAPKKGVGFDIEEWFGNIIFNIFSRFMGMIIKFVTIIIGIAVEIVVFILGIIIFVLWLIFLPFLLFCLGAGLGIIDLDLKAIFK